jgi:hypothetical protein
MAAELWGVVQAAADGLFFPTEILPETFSGAVGERALNYLVTRGLRSTAPDVRVSSLQSPFRVTPPFSSVPFEWHAGEDAPTGPFAWSGPACRSGIELPILLDCAAELVIAGTGTLVPEAWESITVSVGDRDVPLTRSVEGPFLTLRGLLEPSDQPDPSRPVVAVITVPSVSRPFDHGHGVDRRWLGAAICFVELRAGARLAGEGRAGS